jgi:hypothetical protein
MPDFASLQAAFAAALTARDAAVADVRVLRGPAARVRRRLGFYRGNVQAGAYKALRNAYPVCERLVGESFFEGMVYAHAAAHPSVSGDLNAYGAELGAFIRSFAPAASLPYLADVASLEWQVHRAHYAADRPPLDLRELSRLAPERFGDLRAVLHPACAPVLTATPATSIWLAHQPGSDGHFAVDVDAGPERALVHRPAWRVEVARLAPAPHAFLVACEAGATLIVALQQAQAHDATFGLDAHLAGWVRDRVIVELRLP